MSDVGAGSGPTEEAAVVAAARAGDEAAFGAMVKRRRETYAGRSTFRAWLYRIATNADERAIAEMLAEDARCGQQPGAGGHMASEPTWYSGRDLLVAAWAPILHGPDAAEFRFVSTSANRQPAAAQYIRPRGSQGEFRAFALTVVRVHGGVVADLSVFAPEVFDRFGLPRTL